MASGIDFKRVSSSGNPASTHDRLWNDANGTLYFRDSNGVQNQVSPASGGGGGFTSFDIYDGSNTQTIADSNTLTFTGNTGIDGTVSATDTLTLDLDITKLTSAAGTLTDSDYLLQFDVSANAHKRWQYSGLPTITSIDGTNDKFPVVDATDNRLKLVAGDNLPSSGGGTPTVYHGEYRFSSPQDTTSGTYADVDGTNVKQTVSLSGGETIVAFFSVPAIQVTGGTGTFKLVAGSTDPDTLIEVENVYASTNYMSNTLIIGQWTGLGSGSIDFKPQFKTSANTNRIENEKSCIWEVRVYA